MAQKNNSEELFAFAITLANVVKNMFKQTLYTRLSSEPVLEKKPIVEFMHKMRIFGMEKFSKPTLISTINYYASDDELAKTKALGTILVYVEQDYVPRLLKIFQYPNIDEEDEEALKDGCGTLCNVIAGQFKQEVARQGYIEMKMSHFSNFLNSAFLGIQFSPNQKEKYEISFFIGGEKRLVVEISLGAVPKAAGEY